jgi:hypothetical protein
MAPRSGSRTASLLLDDALVSRFVTTRCGDLDRSASRSAGGLVEAVVEVGVGADVDLSGRSRSARRRPPTALWRPSPHDDGRSLDDRRRNRNRATPGRRLGRPRPKPLAAYFHRPNRWSSCPDHRVVEVQPIPGSAVPVGPTTRRRAVRDRRGTTSSNRITGRNRTVSQVPGNKVLEVHTPSNSQATTRPGPLEKCRPLTWVYCCVR